MKKLVDRFSSMTVTIVLLVIFAASIGYATFLENDKGTEMARQVIYNATWFEILLYLLILNLAGSIYKYELLKKKKFSVLMIHLSFVVILIGAGITRYFGSEGIMHIREGETTNEISSDSKVLKVSLQNGNEQVSDAADMDLTPEASNNFNKQLNFQGKTFVFAVESYLQNVKETLVPDETGFPAMSLFYMNANQGGHDVIIQDGQEITLDEMTINFKSGSEGMEGDQTENSEGIRFEMEGDQLYMYSPVSLMAMQMMENGTPDMIQAGERTEVQIRTVYRSTQFTFVVKSFLPHATTNLVQNDPHMQSSVIQAMQNAVVFRVSDGFNTRRINLMLSETDDHVVSQAKLGGVNVKLEYGTLNKQLPFSIQLKDFQLDRYPGSNSPSSYASEINVIDPSRNIEQPFRIYMNNILNYRGYRFFQASYDEDEKGTILQVSDDYWGTTITYIGYLFLLISMILNFFNPNSRLITLMKLTSSTQNKRRAAGILILAAALTSSVMANDNESYKLFQGELSTMLVQDQMQGRVEPFNSFASDVLRKLAKTEKYNGQPAEMVVLGMMAKPESWKNEPFLVVRNPILAAELGAIKNKVSFNQLFDFENGGSYRLSDRVNEAYHKEVNVRNAYDKEVIYLDERINICYQIFMNQMPKLFPPSSPGQGDWQAFGDLSMGVSPMHGHMGMHHGMDMGSGMGTGEGMDEGMGETHKLSGLDMVKPLVLQSTELYSTFMTQVIAAMNTQNWNGASQALQVMKQFQLNEMPVKPDLSRIRMEVVYNGFNIFGKLPYVFLIFGMLLLGICLWQVFSENTYYDRSLNLAYYAFYVSFSLYTLGLIMRWYISEHAPWSNGYESMLYVGWATMLAGIVFSRRSPLTMAVTGILTSIALVTANMSWMNPEITNLVPVLKSYWLIIHVAVITSSYGFLAVGALLGFLNLVLMISKSYQKKKEKKKRLTISIQESSYIIELSLMIGLMLLTIGCFLGGVWANESWGRYWGWDPKETWALVSILIYALVLHLRNIPRLNNPFVLNSLSLISFFSVIMTFVGVNYYLSGMHSYGKGTPPPVPAFLYVILPVIAIVIYMAWRAEFKNKKNADTSIKSKKKSED